VPTSYAAQFDQIQRACSTLEELREQTRVLYEWITAESRLAKANAKKRKRAKQNHKRR
jgi:hypothetical protein